MGGDTRQRRELLQWQRRELPLTAAQGPNTAQDSRQLSDLLQSNSAVG